MKGLFNKQDILSLKWMILLIILSLVFAGGIYYSADLMSSDMANSLRRARSDLQNARTNIDQIEQEEATIIEYIGRYQTLSDDGIVEPEDRLQLIERFTEIRDENDLFPIVVNIGEQKSLRLFYDQTEQDPGGPVDINVTNVEMRLPLLHEGDMIRLLDSILATPGLYFPQECTVRLRNPSQTNFIVLGQHQEADCNLLWFTFNVNPPNNQSY